MLPLMSNLSVSERGMWRRTHFSRRNTRRGLARVSLNGAIPGIYKQIRESYITVIVPSPFSALADEDRRIRDLYTVDDKREQERKEERARKERKRRRGERKRRNGRMLVSMSPFELIGIWINSPARPSEGTMSRECIENDRSRHRQINESLICIKIKYFRAIIGQFTSTIQF